MKYNVLAIFLICVFFNQIDANKDSQSFSRNLDESLQKRKERSSSSSIYSDVAILEIANAFIENLIRMNKLLDNEPITNILEVEEKSDANSLLILTVKPKSDHLSKGLFEIATLLRTAYYENGNKYYELLRKASNNTKEKEAEKVIHRLENMMEIQCNANNLSNKLIKIAVLVAFDWNNYLRPLLRLLENDDENYIINEVWKKITEIDSLFFEDNPMQEDVVEAQPFVTCGLLSGQMGNQMFEIAATLAHAWDNDMIPIFPALNNGNSNIPINKERLFFRLDSSPLPRPVVHTFFQWNNYAKIDIPFQRDQCIIGYFQTWKYFHHHKDKIVEIFKPHPTDLLKIQAKYQFLLDHPCTVGLHVRTFNKKWSNIIPFVGIEYYERAMSLFPDDALFVIFSDRINWCRYHFENVNRPIIFIDDQDHIDDFLLMSMMKHNIIANSTYSWWAAYLNPNPSKIVVAPSHFMTPRELGRIGPSIEAPCNPNLPEWITLEIDTDQNYPEDITDFDEYSKSLDTQ